MGIYHLGAAECLVKHGGKVLQNVQHFAGASAGALVSAVMLLSRDHLKVRLRAWDPGFVVSQIVEENYDENSDRPGR